MATSLSSNILPPPYNDQTGYQPYYPNINQDSEYYEKEQKLKEFFRKYEISPLFQEDVSCIKKYDIIVICDDSGSMAEMSTYLSLRTNKKVTNSRFDQLQETVEIVAELGVILDDDGIDIWFLNRDQPIKNVRSKEIVMSLFNSKPAGSTPLTRVLARVINEPSNKPKLIIIATDGEPTNDAGYPDLNNFMHLLKVRDVDKNRISILACTNACAQIEWLNRIDGETENVDVVNDYISEREQILKVQGQCFTYSQGDHILKMLLGPILQKYCDLDGNKLQQNSQCEKNSQCETKPTQCLNTCDHRSERDKKADKYICMCPVQ